MQPQPPQLIRSFHPSMHQQQQYVQYVPYETYSPHSSAPLLMNRSCAQVSGAGPMMGYASSTINREQHLSIKTDSPVDDDDDDSGTDDDEDDIDEDYHNHSFFDCSVEYGPI